MRQEVTTAALAGQSKVRHGSSLCSDSGGMGQVQNLGILRAPVLAAILLGQLEEPQPLTCDGEVARVAADRNWKVHARLSY